MNIKHFLSAAAALTMLAACSEYDPGMSGNVVDLTDDEIKTIKEYTENFVDRYGEMDPNHTWGFGDLAGTEDRGTRASDPESNEWVKVVTGKGQKKNAKGEPLYYDTHNGNQETTVSGTWVDWGAAGMHWEDFPVVPLYGGDVPIAFEIKAGVVVPGFPVKNYYLSSDYRLDETTQYDGTQLPANRQGWYHFRFANDTQERWFQSEEAILQYMRDNNISDGIIPLGDVATCNTLTDAEVADVYAEFSKEWHGTNPTIDLKSYFVQQVWRGNAQYPYWAQADQGNETPSGYMVGGNNMDYLVAYGAEYSAGDAEHFYNYNGSNFSNGQGGMMLIYNSNTKNFAYHNSWMDLNNTNPTGATMWDHFRLVELHGNYYVGFDFESMGVYDKDIERDYIYNDWIVKIIPGEGTIVFPDEEVITETVPEEQERTISRRIMCEDLGNTYDYDFNDLVFNVTYVGKEVRSKTTTTRKKKDTGEILSQTVTYTDWTVDGNGWAGTITLEASGGTLPIYIENFDGQKVECHEYMVGSNHANLKVGNKYNPINVGVNLNGVEPKSLPTVTGLQTANPDDINIFVYSNDGARADKQLLLPRSRDAQSDGSSKAPQKLCVPEGMRWLKENQQIEWVYDYFRNWVNNESSEYNFGGTMDWTTYGLKQTEKLY